MLSSQKPFKCFLTKEKLFVLKENTIRITLFYLNFFFISGEAGFEGIQNDEMMKKKMKSNISF